MIGTARSQQSDSLLFDFGRYFGTLALVAAATILASWVSNHGGTSAVDMVYLPAVLAAGVWWGFGPAILGAVASALAYNYFFTEPLHTLRIDRPTDIVDVIILFLVAIVTSRLAAGVREQARVADAHASRNATIAGFARRLLSASTERDIADTAAQQIASLFDCNTIFLSGFPQPEIIAAAPAKPTLTPADWAAAAHTLQSGQVAGHGAISMSPAEWMFHPIGSSEPPLAALGLARDDGRTPVDESRSLLLESLLDQTALALTRVRNVGSSGVR